MMNLNPRDLLTALYRAFISPTKASRSYSQCGEDMVLRYLFAHRKTPGFYVDVGCHHPRRGSNTFHLYQRKGWRGILIDLEPAKVYACKLVRWRDKCVLAAVSDKQEAVTIYAPKKFSVLATIDPQSRGDGFKAVRTVTSRTLTDILDEQHAPANFQLLSIDAEGVDLAVLKGLDFTRYKPEVICIEIWEAKNGLDALVKSEINQYLNRKNYVLASWAGMSAMYKAEQISRSN
jgi:FkbM family methyltransferase